MKSYEIPGYSPYVTGDRRISEPSTAVSFGLFQTHTSFQVLLGDSHPSPEAASLWAQAPCFWKGWSNQRLHRAPPKGPTKIQLHHLHVETHRTWIDMEQVFGDFKIAPGIGRWWLMAVVVDQPTVPKESQRNPFQMCLKFRHPLKKKQKDTRQTGRITIPTWQTLNRRPPPALVLQYTLPQISKSRFAHKQTSKTSNLMKTWVSVKNSFTQRHVSTSIPTTSPNDLPCGSSFILRCRDLWFNWGHMWASREKHRTKFEKILAPHFLWKNALGSLKLEKYCLIRVCRNPVITT